MLKVLLMAGLFFAEIGQVGISWNPNTCTRDCLGMMQRSLDKFPGAAEFTMDGKKGRALIRWKPNVGFDLTQIKRLYQGIGIGFGRGDISIEVRGVISSDAKGYIITSIGDDTRFRLIGESNANPVSFQSSGSWQSFPLTSSQKTQFAKARSDDLVTDISGTIFFNNTDYPMIQVKRIEFPNLLPNE